MAKQLWRLTRRDFRAPNYVDENWNLHDRPGDNIPLIHWPDGSWCHSANTYIRELFERGLSRRNRGGTLMVTAAHISRLIRFCWRHRIDFIDLTDNQFTQFINELKTEIGRGGQKVRDANSVIGIGRSCIALLASVGAHQFDGGFVAEDGRIRAFTRQHTVELSDRSKGGARTKTQTYWHHNSFPTPDTKKSRMPISREAIEKMRAAVHTVSSTSHHKLRRYVLLKLLEITGGRRSEVAAVTTRAVINAAEMDEPMLKMITLKKEGGRSSERYVPISRADAKFLHEFVSIQRRSIIRRTIGTANDHGIVLVNDRTSQPLASNTITQEVRILAKAAGIKQKSCPHMFRHRFITKLFAALIEQHDLQNTDQFRKLLLDSEALKRKVAEWTDHSNPDSLEPYIHLAFEEISSFKKSYSIVKVSMAIDSFLGTLSSELQELRVSGATALTADRLLKFTEAFKADLESAQTVLA